MPEFLTEIMPYLVPLIAAIIGFILAKLIGVTVDVAKIIPILLKIIEAIWKVEIKTIDDRTAPGAVFNEYREQLAKDIINTALTPKQKSTANKVMGGINAGLKFVFPFVKPVMDDLLKKK